MKRTIFASIFAAALLCLNTFAFTPEAAEQAAEPAMESKQLLLNEELTSELLFFQDFDQLPVGVCQSGDIAGMLAGTEGNKLVDFGKMGWGVISEGCSFEVCEEENGNRYLKVTGDIYKAFGVWFENDALHYSVASFNYKYPAADTCKTVNSATYSAKGTMYVGNNSWAADGALTDAANTAWTQVSGKPHSVVQGPCFGLAFNQSSGESVIYIDDLTVWSFSESVETAHNSAVAKTVSFANTSGYEAAEMPADITRCVWYNIYNAQNKDKVTVDLSTIVPLSAPSGYAFAGWSASEGSTRVKDCQYRNFRVPGDFTFYALWEKAKPTVVYEDFEGFAVGQALTGDDLAFLNLGQLGYDTSATVILDELTGSKALKISAVRFGGFELANRNLSAQTEYFTFDYRFETGDGPDFTAYRGENFTAGHILVAKKAVWSNFIQFFYPTDRVYGFYFSGYDAGGNYSIIIDNLYYWAIPAGLTNDEKKATISFTGSTKGVFPENAEMPEPIEKDLWENANTDDNTLHLKTILPSSVPGYRFLGWSRADGGTVIGVNYNDYRAIKDETLYAVWEIDTPVMTGLTSIRTNENEPKQAIRFQAKVSGAMFMACEEMGFLATRESKLAENEQLTLELGNGKVVSTAVDKSKVQANTDDSLTWAVVLKNIPKKAEYLKEELIVRAYVKLGGNIYYGNPAKKSIYDTAKSYANEYPDNLPEAIQEIIRIAEQDAMHN